MALVDRTEYLKRYMSKDEIASDGKKRKKKKTKSSKESKLKIIDDDIDVKSFRSGQSLHGEEEAEEDMPLVAEVVDERPKHIRELETYRNSRWKVMGQDKEEDDYGVLKKDQVKMLQKKKVRHDSDTDESPPRSKSTSKQRLRHDSDSDVSHKNNFSPSKKPSSENRNRTRHDSDSDTSFTNSNYFSSVRKSSDSEIRKTEKSEKIKKRKDFDSDHSPPRKMTRNKSESQHSLLKSKASTSHFEHSSDSDYSGNVQDRKKNLDSDSDQSPLRTVPQSDQSPFRRTHDTDSDQSPIRKRMDSDSDQSPVRRRINTDSDQSPLRRRKNSDSDQSPLRRRKNSDSDQSPIRKKKAASHSDLSPTRKVRKGRDDNAKKATKTLGGAKAGLSSAAEMKEEASRLREKEDREFQKIDQTALGRNAQTVVRDRTTGKRRNLEAEKAVSEEEERKKREQEERYKTWGQGLKQQQDKETRLADQVQEADKPLARYQNDKDLDQMLRQQEREEDPMLAFIKSKRKKEEAKSGKKKKELPRYKGPTAPPPNRFNIQPGYRWDGVDRSNGFEKKIFDSIANKKAIQEIAYKWSTEDM